MGTVLFDSSGKTKQPGDTPAAHVFNLYACGDG